MELEIGLWQKCWWNPTLIWNWRNLTVITLDMFISFLDICTVTGFMRTVVVGCCWVPKTCYANPSNWLKYRMTPTQTRKTGRKPWISGILLGIPWKIGLQNLSHLGSAVLSSGNLICFGRGCHSRCSSNIWYRVGIILSLQYIKQSIQNPFCLCHMQCSSWEDMQCSSWEEVDVFLIAIATVLQQEAVPSSFLRARCECRLADGA